VEKVNEDNLLLFMDSDLQLVNKNYNRSVFDLDEIQAFLLSGKSFLVISKSKSFTFGPGIIFTVLP
jgi:hypothetical protein